MGLYSGVLLCINHDLYTMIAGLRILRPAGVWKCFREGTSIVDLSSVYLPVNTTTGYSDTLLDICEAMEGV